MCIICICWSIVKSFLKRFKYLRILKLNKNCENLLSDTFYTIDTYCWLLVFTYIIASHEDIAQYNL